MDKGVPKSGDGGVPKNEHSNYFRRKNPTEPRQLEPRDDKKKPAQADPVETIPYPNRPKNFGYVFPKQMDEPSTSDHQPSSNNNQSNNKYLRNWQKKKPIKQQNSFGNSNNNGKPYGGGRSILKSDSEDERLFGNSSNSFIPLKVESSEFDSDSDPGDMSKMDLMTAADLDCDRYARYGIHESEIKDNVRTTSFKRSIEYCAKGYIKNKVVLVIRCGIGLLPLMCVRAGMAKKVIALEESSCIEYARRIVKDNSYGHKITLIQSSVQNLKDLPHGLNYVDIIISDFMGECVLSQGDQMEQVIEARNRFLKPDGLMMPASVSLYAQLLENRRAYENGRIRKHPKKTENKNQRGGLNNKNAEHSEKEAYDSDSSTDSTLCSWWSNVYGFDMRSNPLVVKDPSSKTGDHSYQWYIMTEPVTTFFDSSKVVSDPCLLAEFNMNTCTLDEVRHVVCKDLKVKCITPNASAGDYAHMLELFMVVDFPNGKAILDVNDPLSIGFSTSSFSPCTRYRQTGLLLKDELLIKPDDEFNLLEFHLWRGPQKNLKNKLFDNIINNGNINNRCKYDEHLKFRIRYTFVSQNTKVIDRGCIYTLTKQLF